MQSQRSAKFSDCLEVNSVDERSSESLSIIEPTADELKEPIESTGMHSKLLQEDREKTVARDAENTAETAEATGESSVRQRKIKRSVLRKISHLLPEVLLKKSELCKHDHGCFENTTRSMLRYFLFGFAL